MATVEWGRTDIASPSDIGIGNMVEVEAVTATKIAGGPVNRLGIGVSRLQLQVTGDATMHLGLQRIVVGVGPGVRQLDTAESGKAHESVEGGCDSRYSSTRCGSWGGVAARQTGQNSRRGQIRLLGIALEPVLIPDIRERKYCVVSESLLHSEAVLIAGWNLVIAVQSDDR